MHEKLFFFSSEIHTILSGCTGIHHCGALRLHLKSHAVTSTISLVHFACNECSFDHAFHAG
jgi:hypothetical protein